MGRIIHYYHLGNEIEAPKSDVIKTNADRVRAMTDEELVNQFTETMGFCCPVKGVDCSLEPDCRACFDRWLKQEVTE